MSGVFEDWRLAQPRWQEEVKLGLEERTQEEMRLERG